MATRLTKKQQTQLTEKLTGIIQKNNALQLRLSMDNSVNEMNVNQISGALNRIHGQAIGKELPTEITIPVKQLGSGDPSPDNIRPIVGYEIDGIGTVYGGDLNIDTGILIVTYGIVDLGSVTVWANNGTNSVYFIQANRKAGSQTGISNQLMLVDSNMGSHLMPDNTFKMHVTSNSIIIKKTGVTVANAQSLLDGVYIVYELATPETYTLTPAQLIQLLDQL